MLNARHLRNVHVRKTHVADAVDRATGRARPVRPTFVPPAPIRELRNLTRYGRRRSKSGRVRRSA